MYLGCPCTNNSHIVIAIAIACDKCAHFLQEESVAAPKPRKHFGLPSDFGLPDSAVALSYLPCGVIRVHPSRSKALTHVSVKGIKALFASTRVQYAYLVLDSAQ